MHKIIVTGCAGFIGYHLSKKLFNSSHKIIGIDNVNNYYDQRLKLDRLSELKRASKITKVQWDFFEVNLEDDDAIKSIFNNFKPDIVIHLAAQAGVRYSLKNPKAYINSNIVGFNNIIEACKNLNIKKTS